MDRLKLQENLRYALDPVVPIYFLERHPQFYQAARNIFSQIESGQISAVCSTLVFAELLVPAFRAEKNEQAKKVVHILTNFPNLEIIPMTIDISITAARLRTTTGYAHQMLST